MAEVADLAAHISVEGADTASASLATFGRNVDSAGRSQGQAADLSLRHTESLRAMSTAALVAGGALEGGLTLGVHAATGLETALAPIGTLLGANSGQARVLTGDITKLVAESPQSADELGMSAYTILSAGISGTTNVMDALRASQKLSEAGLGSMADATGLVTSAINSFKGESLTADSAAKIFFGTITTGKTTTAGLAEGFGEIAPLAAAAGVSFHDLLGATSALTQTGASASNAYTGLREIIVSVLKPTSQATDAAKQLGLEFSAAHLKNVGLPAFLDEVKRATGGNTAEMAQLFGRVDGLNAALALTGPQAQAFADNLKNIDNAGAGLNKRAEEMDATLGNTFKRIGNEGQVALAEGIQPLVPAVETLLQGVVGLAGAFTTLPGPEKLAIEAMLGLAGAGLLAFGTFAKLNIGFNTATNYLRSFGEQGTFAGNATTVLANNLGNVIKVGAGLSIVAVSFEQIGKSTEQSVGGILGMAAGGALIGSAFGPVGTVIGGATGAVAGLTKALISGGESVDEYRSKFVKLGAELDTLGQTAATVQFEKKLGITDLIGMLQGGTEGVHAIRNELESLGATSPAAVEKVVAGLKAMHDEDGKPLFTGKALAELDGIVARVNEKYATHAKNANDAKAANDKLAGSLTGAGAAADGAASAITPLAQQLQDAKAAADDFKTSMDSVLGIGLDVESTNLRWIDSLVGVEKALHDNGATLDQSTEAGRKNREAMIGAAQAAETHAEAVFKQTGSVQAASEVIGHHIDDLAASARNYGIADSALIPYLEDLFNIPPEARTNITTTADIAAYEVTQLQQFLDGLKTPVTAPVNADASQAHGEIAGAEFHASAWGHRLDTAQTHADASQAHGELSGAEFHASAWGHSVYVAHADADASQAHGEISGAEFHASAWGHRLDTANIYALAHTGDAEAALDNVSRDRIAAISAQVRAVTVGGAHGLVGLQHGGAAAGMLVGPHQPVVIGEGISREAVVPYDNFDDMVATIRNSGQAGQFFAAAAAAGGSLGLPGTARGGDTYVTEVHVHVQGSVVSERDLLDKIQDGLVRAKRYGRDLGFS